MYTERSSTRQIGTQDNLFCLYVFNISKHIAYTYLKTTKNYAAGWLALCVHLRRKIVGGKKKENAISAVFIDKSFNVVISFCASFTRRCVM